MHLRFWIHNWVLLLTSIIISTALVVEVHASTDTSSLSNTLPTFSKAKRSLSDTLYCNQERCLCIRTLVICVGLSITKIPETISKTTYLILSKNKIETIPDYAFLYWNNLLVLDLSHNRISTLNYKSFAGLSKLLQINLSYNLLNGPLSADVFDSLISLTEIYLQFNHLTRISSNTLSQNVATYFTNHRLKTLYLNNNNLTHLDDKTFSNLIYLTEITLQNNRINATNFLPPNLEYIDIRNNSFTFLRNNTFSKSPHVRYVSLGQPQLKLKYDDFEGLRILSYLHFDRLEITHFPKNYFNRLLLLNTLIISNANKLQTIPPDISQATNLRKLYLIDIASATELTDIPMFLDELYIFRCTSLKVGSISLQKLSFLETLVITQVNVSVLSFSSNNNTTSLERLQTLSLNKLGLTEFNSSWFFGSKLYYLLTTISLADNAITEESKTSFQNFPALKKINLTQNQLKSFDLDVFSNQILLQDLDLSNNQITHFLNLKFSGYSIQTLNLSGNLIESLEKESFLLMPDLTTLNIANNRITRLNGLSEVGLINVNLILYNNSWTCTCDFLSAYNLLAKSNILECQDDSGNNSCLQCFNPQTYKMCVLQNQDGLSSEVISKIAILVVEVVAAISGVFIEFCCQRRRKRLAKKRSKNLFSTQPTRL